MVGGRLMSPSAPVATPLLNSGQAVTSADAPPPGACCTSVRYCQTLSPLCSAAVKAAQQVRQMVALKASAKVNRKKKHSIYRMHPAHLSMREVKVDCCVLLLGQAASQAQRGESHRLGRQRLHGPCAWPGPHQQLWHDKRYREPAATADTEEDGAGRGRQQES